MSDWFTVASLIALGIALIIVEVLFVPGTTVVGILGFVSAVVGVYLGFEYFGEEIGWWIFGGTTVAFAASLYFGFKGGTWDKFSLKDTSEGRVNDGYWSSLKVGDKGVALSTLRPIGKAEFNDKEYEVRSYGNYIDSTTKIEIVKIDGNRIYVEPLK
ncbi:hypothetical protein E1176_12210 [Fulvivirga sp. RKSG066]|uniref:NfeD family protein n=1 Tax=Fulvivirga aurantia TaxID=2529383 RepID=UPI0012BC575B|nr:NfeD family protein [Fulvivirga aurantia]MTI21786.1 hypothetical protein [Fulvivirga aurantia]